MHLPATQNDWTIWLRGRLLRTAGLAVLLMVMQVVVAFSRPATGWVADPRAVPREAPTTTHLAAAEPRSVQPSGWRRTVDGWEKVSDWGDFPTINRLSLGDWIMRQKATEPSWLRSGLAAIASIPPLAFATGQLLAISLLVVLRRDQRCHATGQ